MRDPSHLWNSVDGVYKSLYGRFAPRIVPSTKWVTFALAGLQLQDKIVTLNDIQDLLTKAVSHVSKSGSVYRRSKSLISLFGWQRLFIQNTKQTKEFSFILLDVYKTHTESQSIHVRDWGSE